MLFRPITSDKKRPNSPLNSIMLFACADFSSDVGLELDPIRVPDIFSPPSLEIYAMGIALFF